MSEIEALSKTAQTLGLNPGSTSYFSQPSKDLDPTLFEGTTMHSDIRTIVIGLLFEVLNRNFAKPEEWAFAWLAGSGVSYQWESARTPADLDCLVGVEYVRFRNDNPEYMGLSDSEIASLVNEVFSEQLNPTSVGFLGKYDLTYYVNNQTQVADLKPYAAYNLFSDSWSVPPKSDQKAPSRPAWDHAVTRDRDTVQELIGRYSKALTDVQGATNTAHRVNAERQLNLVLEQAEALYEEVHKGRKLAFSPTGEGYEDWHNYRWQAGKQGGTIEALKTLVDYQKTLKYDSEEALYGVKLPDARTLIRRGATYRSK
jgi:hypothetical protein